MPNYNPEVPKAPLPTKIFFDPYNSSSTGHQRAKNRLSGSTSWRDSRAYKLKHQFSDTSGRGGQSHLSDLAGAGSENFGKDGKKENGDWEKGAPGLREGGWQDIRDMIGGERKRKSPSALLDEEGMVHMVKQQRHEDTPAVVDYDNEAEEAQKRVSFSSNSETGLPPFPSAQPQPASQPDNNPSTASSQSPTNITTSDAKPPPIFRNLTIYVNGSTAPLISDHHLKQLFFQHGGAASISLGRRTVTHVIVGVDCGGGLAGTKIQKEVANVRGKGFKFVTAQWVIDSVEKGVRQPEGRYVPGVLRGRLGGAGQGSVRGFFGGK